MMQLGPWLPDLPAYGHQGLVRARNVFPTQLGYSPVKQFAATTTAIPYTWRGGRSYVGPDGTVALLAGTDSGLYSYASSTWTSEVAGSYTGQWEFEQFGDLVVCVNGSAPLKYTLSTGAGATLGGTPPSGTYVTSVKDFVFISGVSSANSTVYWSAINNAEGWTIGTDQADSQLLPDGGKVTGISGGEYLLAFQREQIWRAQYVGTPLIFQFDKVSSNIGCLTSKSIARAGRMVFFYSQRGFYMWNDGELRAIGAQKVDETFATSYSRADIESSIWSAVDPQRKIVVWAMPNRLWVYNWELDRWSDIEVSAFAVSTQFSANTSLESIDTLYPGGIDTVPISLDSPIFSGGDPSMAIIANDGTIGTFSSGDNLTAILETPKMEIAQGRQVRIRAARIDTDAVSGVTLTLLASSRLGDSQTSEYTASIRTNGDMPIRASGRYVQTTINVTSGTSWSFIHGIDFIAAPGVVQ
ncbi:MAG: hypothetical protein KGM99_05605 [Burkholderiales bacterium]|nr:hypothetical protein [Burkholderiales bacterium]